MSSAVSVVAWKIFDDYPKNICSDRAVHQMHAYLDKQDAAAAEHERGEGGGDHVAPHLPGHDPPAPCGRGGGGETFIKDLFHQRGQFILRSCGR